MRSAFPYFRINMHHVNSLTGHQSCACGNRQTERLTPTRWNNVVSRPPASWSVADLPLRIDIRQTHALSEVF
jgi:hypothetical protein